MRRFALYARFSDDELQDARSITDQVALLRARVAAEGGHIVHVYADEGISGANILNRPAARNLLTDASLDRFDVVLAEGLDRLSRDLADTATIFKRLTFHGVSLETLADGPVNELHVGLRGTINAIYLKDLAAKVRRGQAGTVKRGKNPGGLCYGYRVVRKVGEGGEIERGLREIDPEQAEVVQRIYREYLSGLSAKTIAFRLNADGIRNGAGAEWSTSTVNGNRKRETGILCNPIYTGRIVWNRVHMVKDPDTGRRVHRFNNASEIVEVRDENLRIISDSDWERVQKIKGAAAGVPLNRRVRPKHLLSGLVICGACGGAYTMKTPTRLGCSRHHERGTCPNARTLKVAELEARVVGGLRRELMRTEIVAEALAEYRLARQAASRRARRRASDRARELNRVETGIARLLDAIMEGTDTAATRERLRAMEARKAELDAEGRPEAEVVELHPNFAEAFGKALDNVCATLSADPVAAAEARAALRALVEAVVVHPGPKAGTYELELRGSLGGILALASGNPGQPFMVVMVAEARVVHGHNTPTLSIWI